MFYANLEFHYLEFLLTNQILQFLFAPFYLEKAASLARQFHAQFNLNATIMNKGICTRMVLTNMALENQALGGGGACPPTYGQDIETKQTECKQLELVQVSWQIGRPVTKGSRFRAATKGCAACF